MESKNNNRWQINKIGLLNYWWYDEEEFEFSDGRMILRGTNGSGKSVTMQSFIPLLLDGKKTPERLDPFGNKARKIEDYVLGYGDDIKEENTSYLYMEFCKKEINEYITVGMGFRAKRGQPVSFWGFLINDGRRIGKDFYLYKELDNKIPLTKQELKNRLGTGGKFVETQKEYMNMVNEHIFKFETIEEYEEFIKLLIEIRTPKLSKGEGFRPSTVIEIMSNSLQQLSDEDLRPVSESIENMNKTKEQLKFLKDSKKAIDNIMGSYKTYNECVLFNKAKRYVAEDKEYKEAVLEQRKLQEKIENNKKELSDTVTKIEEIKARIQAVEFKEQELNKNEAWNLQKNLQELENNLKGIINNLTDKKNKQENQETENRKKENELKINKQEYEKLLDDFNKINNEISEKSTEIYYDEYFFRIDDIKKDINLKYDYLILKNDLKRYIDKITEARKLLELIVELEKIYDDKQRELDSIKSRKISKDNEITKNREDLENAKEDFIEKMYAWEKANEILKINEDNIRGISQKIQNYGEMASFDDIISEVRKPYNEINSKILEKKINIENEKNNLIEKREFLKQEIEEWKNKKEPEPDRRLEVIENRKKLEEKNIPFIPLYRAVEFKKDIREEIKANIESALEDMGLLDALIISKKNLNDINIIDSNFVDKYLIPKPQEFKHDLTELLDIKLPENSKIIPEDVYNVLKTIMLTDDNEDNYITEKGTYKIGMIKGQALTGKQAQFIGVEARKKYKENKILELENLVAEISQNIEEKIKLLTDEENKEIKLQQEFQNFMTKDILEEKYNILKISINDLESIKNEINIKENELINNFEKLKDLKIKLEEKTLKMQFTKTIDGYQNAENTANEVKEQIYELEKIHNELVNSNQKIIIIEEHLEQAYQNLDDILYDINKLEQEKRTIEAKINSIKEMQKGDIEDLKRQMEECLRLKHDLPKEKDVLIARESKLNTDVEYLNEQNLKITEKVEILLEKTNILRNIFVEELNLKYVENVISGEKDDNELALKNAENKVVDDTSGVIKLDNKAGSAKEVIRMDKEEALKIANKIINKYQDFDRRGNPVSYYLDNLLQKTRENSEHLTDYNLTIEDILKTDIDSSINNNMNNNIGSLDNLSLDNLNEKYRNLYAEKVRKDIRCYVKGQKVNLIKLDIEVADTIKDTEMLIEEDDRRIFEDILTNTVGRKIRERIYHAKQWVKAMNDLMESIDTTSKLSFSLNWKPKVATDETEVDTRELVDILNSDSKILRQEEITKVANHFRSKFAKAEQRQKEEMQSFHNIMREVLDYRTWFEFQFNYKKGDDTKKELTNNAFFKLSGGEKALAMYIPLFAAVVAKYESAGSNSPRIISLDEAFAGVDDSNIRDMFRILTKLDLEYVINSQVLWGEYDTIPSLAINELVSDPKNKVVCVIRYHWNGIKRELV